MPKRSATRSVRCSPRWALRLSEAKTRVCHINEGFDFLGWRIQRPGLPEPDRQEGDLHLPIEEGTGLGDGEGAIAHPQGEASNARRPAAPT